MSNLYPIVFILQGYCVYHAYQNQKPIHWYLLIIFLPILGALIYLYLNFGSRMNLENVGEPLKGVVNNNYEVDKLIKDSEYYDTISNRIKLADTYVSKEKYLPAISLYESCLQGFNSDDIETKEKLMVAKYFMADYEGVLELGNSLNELPIFRDSESRIAYAWSLSFTNNPEKAEEVFKGMEVNFSNYIHRYEYAKFLIEKERSEEAKVLLADLEDEISHMESGEQERKKPIRKEINTLLNSLN